MLPGKPWEETVADQAVAEVRRQQAQRPAKRCDAQRRSQRDPTRTQRSVRVDHALRLPGGSRREENQRILIGRAEPGGQGTRHRLRLGFRGVEHFRSQAAQCARQAAIGRAGPQREARRRGPRQRFDFEGRQPGIDRNGASSEAPDGDQIDEKRRRVAVVQEHAVAGAQTMTAEEAETLPVTGEHHVPVPVRARHRLGQRAERHVREHVLRGAPRPAADVDRRGLTRYEPSDTCNAVKDAMTPSPKPRVCIGLPGYTGARHRVQASDSPGAEARVA